MSVNFNQIAVIGLGLIGGSLAAGIRQRSLARSVVAYDRDPASLARGMEMGIIDQCCESIEAAAEHADLVVICVPVKSVEDVLRFLPADKLMTDVGSVKAPVIEASTRVFGAVPPGLVPAHPIAGSEQHGVGAANGDLFAAHKVILTPLAETDSTATHQVAELWRNLGAAVVHMTVAHHDAVLAQTSHLPHLLAYALVDTLSAQGDSLEIFQYAAGGFRDFTRIAASDPVMWRDIFSTNGPAVLDILDRYMTELAALRAMIADGDTAGLEAVFVRAKHARDHYSKLQQSRSDD